MKKSEYHIPWLPISALIFYLTAVILWSIKIIPSPVEIISFLENLYNNYGLIGLSIATFLEGIVYLGLYFPGSFIILLSVILSDGTFVSLFKISIVVSLTLTLTSIINYWLGRHMRIKSFDEELPSSKNTKGLVLSSIHPNLLAFYFFDQGLEKKSFFKILYVPFVMLVIGLIYSYLIYSLRFILRNQIEKPYLMIGLIFIWFIVAFIFENKRRLRKNFNIK
jgi:membrane protein YqaA with SNARE-associated domain